MVLEDKLVMAEMAEVQDPAVATQLEAQEVMVVTVEMENAECQTYLKSNIK